MIGDFTSSGIGNLMTTARNGVDFGAPALTYIEEKRFERNLGRKLETESNARATTWGDLAEIYFFQKQELSLSTEILNKVRFRHKSLNWSGAPDGLEGNCVIDLKSPYTMKSFCQFSECETIEEVRKNHKSGDLYFWQLVSNSILIEQERGVKITHGELIVFCPHFDELTEIQALACSTDLIPARKLFWIANADFEELPHLTNESKYKSINRIKFEILEEWKEQLIERVKKSEALISEI